MTRRVQVPRAQLLPTDTLVSDPMPGDPDALIEVDREEDPPAPPPTATQQVVDAAVALGVALADRVTSALPATDPELQTIKDARQRLIDAAGGTPSDPTTPA